jgi:hypothetical protein
VRKHQKIEDPRFLYWADREGLLVWEELPSAYRFTKRSVDRSIRLWQEAIDRDLSHPCIIVRVPLNESTGVPNLRAAPGQRDYVHALYRLTKTLDPDRPVDGNDGWESVATDIIGIHDYDRDLDRLARRYASEDDVDRLITRERPGGRLLALEGHPHAGLPIMLSEFGGAALSDDPDTSWGYVRLADANGLAEWYERILEVVRTRPILSGFCYTQFADTYQEKNGLLYADRRPKFPLERIADATRGPRNEHDEADEERRRVRASTLGSYWDATVPRDLSLSHESEQ